MRFTKDSLMLVGVLALVVALASPALARYIPPSGGTTYTDTTTPATSTSAAATTSATEAAATTTTTTSETTTESVATTTVVSPSALLNNLADQLNALLKQLIALLTAQLNDLKQQLTAKLGQQPVVTTPTPATTATTTAETAVATTTVAVENKPPRVNITYPYGGLQLTAPASADVIASAFDEDGSIAKVEFFEGNNSLGVHTSPVGPWNVRWSGAAAGNYTLTAKVTDDKGAVTTSAPVELSVKALSETEAGFRDIAPTITIVLAPTSASTTTNVVITATPATYAGSISQVVYYRAASTTSATVETRTAAPWNSSTTLPAVGVHTVSATATNSQGSVTNSGSTTINVCNSGTC